MDDSHWQDVKSYMGFGEREAALLRAFEPVAAPHFGLMVDDFYSAIAAHPRASQAISGGQRQVERLKRTLQNWLHSVLVLPRDGDYLHAHSRIGHVHVRIELPQEFMFSAMNRLRRHLHRVARESGQSDELHQAIDQALDLELSIMLDAYGAEQDARLRSQERLATIGQLAAGIGHELRNPLGVIESSLFLIRQRLGGAEAADADLAKHVDKIERQLRRCRKTITDLLDLARSASPHRSRIAVSWLLDAALEAAALPERIVVQRELAPELFIDVDPDQMRQVLINLLSNAEQAMVGQTDPCIVLRGRAVSGGTELSVCDSGPGVASENQARIFDALFTTKATGNGLGLALCKRILDAHRGEIDLVPGQTGACFRIFVPDAEMAGSR